jgi:peptidoglycan hydrolase-like protein with peptidoglycan-binding domain
VPTPERYKEIEQALTARGYLKQAPDGIWDAASVDALRRFQQDQNLSTTGKIDSLSLIALGLGPKRDTAAATVRPRSTQEP